MSDVVKLMENSFEEEVLQAKKPVLVDFWAPWCAPCKALNPIIEELAEERKDDIKIVKVNVDEHQTLAAQYGIRGIPSLSIFHEAQLIETKVGSCKKMQLNAFIDLALSKISG